MKVINYSIQITPKANAQQMVRFMLCEIRKEMFIKLAPKQTITAKWIIKNTNSVDDLISIYELLFSDKAIFDVYGPDASTIQAILTIAILLNKKEGVNSLFLNQN